MPIAYQNLDIRAGSSQVFVVDVIGGPADLTGYVGAMQFRELRDDLLPLAELDPGSITVDAANRQVTVQISSAESSTFDWVRSVYDLKITGPSGDSWILVEGRATSTLAVTRED